jgi:hypothetical protein
MLIFSKKIIKFILNHFTLAKLLGAILTALFVASLKYYISGDLHIEYCDFWDNICVALLGWITNTSIIGWLTEYLGIKGLNLNLNQFIYGFDTIKMGNEYPLEESKPKLYNAMNIDSGDDSNSSKKLDKGKGADRVLHRNSVENLGFIARQPLGENILLDQVPKKINPGSGFNVLGGEVPYNDSIVQHLDYNIHFLNHFKKLDLETAIEQRNNNLLLIRITEGKLNYAKNALSKISPIPTTEYEFRLKNQIISDLDTLNRNKIKAEARTTLLTSRIEFIKGKINKN